MAELAPGLLLAGRYTLERRLGSGGMAQVWSAFDNERGARVAIKALDARFAAQPGMRALLRNEYANVCALAHPHILPVLGLHDADDMPFIVLELAEGGDLRRYVGRPPAEFLPLLLPVVEALAYAHERGVVHRDLKLANVLLDADGKGRLTDFGIAAARARGGLELRTGGTPAAMSPQQLARETPAPADDLYALGVMLYELSTGAPPFAPDATPERIANEPPAPITPGADRPQALIELIAALLAKARADRPAGMAEVANRLRQALSAAATTLPPELSELESASAARFEQVALVSPRPGVSSERVVPAAPAARAFPTKYAVAGVALLLAAAVLVLTLPRPAPAPAAKVVAPAPPPPAPPAASVEIPGPAPFELAKLARARDEAKDLVDHVVELQTQADARAAQEWAAQEYASAVARAQAGDGLFKSQDYDGARVAYREAEQGLQSLLDRAGGVLADALKAGWDAYGANDSAKAIASFQLALKIDPQQADAKRGLRRAQVLDQLNELMASASAAERAGDMEHALAAYRQASALDADARAAREGVQRLTGQLERSDFNDAMSQGFAALDRGDSAAARAAFERAHGLDPKSSAATDALAQIDSQTRVGQIEALQARAEAAEKEEHWSQAAEIYDQVLTLDSTLVFAQKGATRARATARLYSEIDAQLAAADRLSSDAVYARAQALVHSAAALPGAQLAQKRAALEQAMQTQRTPVAVRFESDNATDVVLYQVDELGRFDVRELDLRPGTYTAVGTREGYRDVRRKFTVVAGQTPAPVVVRCEERI